MTPRLIIAAPSDRRADYSPRISAGMRKLTAELRDFVELSR